MGGPLGATSHDVAEPEVEKQTPKFDSTELVQVMTALHSAVNITNASPKGVSATINGINVQIRKV